MLAELGYREDTAVVGTCMYEGEIENSHSEEVVVARTHLISVLESVLAVAVAPSCMVGDLATSGRTRPLKVLAA